MQNQFDPLFQKYGEQHNVPFPLVKAVAEQESNFNPKAKSNKGAIGLMQLMPLISNTYIPKEDPYNPESNVKGATKFLGHLLQKYDGDQEKALMAYYAGETLVDKYVSQNRELPKDIQGYATGVLDKRQKYVKKPVFDLDYPDDKPKKPTFNLDYPDDKLKVKEPKQTEALPTTTITKPTLDLDYPEEEPKPPVVLTTPADKKPKLKVEPVKEEYSLTDKFFQFFGADATPEEAPNNEEIKELLYKQAIPAKGVTKDDVYNLTTDKNIKIIRDYMVARLGFEGRFKKGESREDYIKRFLSHMRKVEFNTGLGSVPELNYVYKAGLDDLKKIKAAHDLYDSIPDFYEEGGSLSGIPESLMYLVFDPTNLVSLGAGAAVKYKLARQGIKSLIDRRITGALAGATLEGSLAGADAAVQTQIDIELIKTSQLAELQTQLMQEGYSEQAIKQAIVNYRKELDESKEDYLNITPQDLAFSIGIGGTFGAIAGFGLGGIPKKTSKEKYLEFLEKKKKELGTAIESPKGKKLREAFDDFMAKEFEDKNIADVKNKTKVPPSLDPNKVLSGRKVLDEIDQTAFPSGMTENKLRDDLDRKILNLSFDLLTADDTFKDLRQDFLEKKIRISDVISRVVATVDRGDLDQDVFEGALTRSGLSEADLENILLTTPSEAASRLGARGALSRRLRKGIELGDPQLKKLIDDVKAADLNREKDMNFYQLPFDFIRRLERESKALVVSSIGTTIRNVYGTTIGLTMDTAAKTLEAGLYYTSKGLASAVTGKVNKPMTESFAAGDFSNFIRDSFGNIPQLLNLTRTAEEFDLVLADNPRIKNLLLTSLQEVGDRPLSVVSRYANTLNVAQDAVFRRTIFVQSVKRQLRAQGMELDDLMARGAKVPMNVIKNASDDALRGTFSYSFRTPVKGAYVERIGSEFARSFIERLESLPGGSLIVPFPRFIANAMAFQYRYSVFQIPAAAGRMIEALSEATLTRNKLLKAGKGKNSAEMLELDAKINALYRDGLMRTARATVGLGVMSWAYHHRLVNQDKSEWYNINLKDGGQIDTRAIFPIAPFLAIGDYLAKMKLGRTDELTGQQHMNYLEAIMGMKLQPESFRGFLDRLPELIAGTEGTAKERIQQSLGEMFGDFLNRFQQPLKPAYALFDMMEEEAQIARDTRQIEGDNIFTEAMQNRVLSAAGAQGPLFAGEALGVGTKLDLPEAVSFFNRNPIKRGGELFTQLQGFRIVPAVNRLEQEFMNLGINPYEIQGYKTRGDRKFDMALRKNALPFLEEMIPVDTYEFGYYKNQLDRQQKKEYLLDRVSTALQVARIHTEGLFSDLPETQQAKRKFRSLTTREQRIINEKHKQDHGETLDESKMYYRFYDYLDKILEPQKEPKKERRLLIDR